MPTRERVAKEARRDAIREMAAQVAEHTAGGGMIQTTRTEDGRTKLAHNSHVHYCECGLPMMPMPHYLKAYGWLPCWVCGQCSIFSIIEFVQAIEREFPEVAA